MRDLEIGLLALCILIFVITSAGLAADQPTTLAPDIALFREGQEAPPHKVLRVVYAHRWSLPGASTPEWQVLYDAIATVARRSGADMVVGAITGEEDPVITKGQVKWFLGLAAISTAAIAGGQTGCDNCIVDWWPPDSSSSVAGDAELRAFVEDKSFIISRLRLAEAGYYLRAWPPVYQPQPDSITPINLWLEVDANRGPSPQLAAPENMSFTARLRWKVSRYTAWTRLIEATAPSSRLEESGLITRNALADLYAQLPTRGRIPDSDDDGILDSMDKEPGTQKGAEVDLFGRARDDDGDGVPNGIDRHRNTPHGVAVDQYGRPLDRDSDGVADYVDRCPDTPVDIVVDDGGCPVEKWVTVIEDALVDAGVLRETLPFDLGKYELRDDARARLDSIGMALKGLSGLHYRVEGHCDDLGTDEFNDILSDNRAKAVVDYLATRYPDLTREQFASKGWGKRMPLVAATDSLSRAINRRVEFLVENPEEAKRVVQQKRTVHRGETVEDAPTE
jgi:outer membrane protein OmpA-like peptidoglycan-associated protein